MRRYNDGMIYTNDRCVACNRCVHVCPAVGANVTANDSGRISVDVSDRNCIHCGKCIRECVHGARGYRDSLEDMLNDISKGMKVSIIVDPAFTIAYGEETARRVFGFLKSLGAAAVYDAAIGGDISLYCHVRYIREHTGKEGASDRYFAHTCPGFSNYVSRYAPEALDKFIPVQLPNVCAAIYYRKYKKIPGRFALLSPCTAIYDEYASYNSGRNINYLVGFSSLMEYIGDRDISAFDSWYEYECGDIGRTFSESEAFSFAASRFFSPKLLFRASSGIDQRLELILRSPDILNDSLHPALFTNDFCPTGCIGGPAIDSASIDFCNSVPGYCAGYEKAVLGEDSGELSPDERYEKLKEKFGYINTMDFDWRGNEDYHQKSPVPDSITDEIFAAMHKNTNVKRNINCRACGYTTCIEMVSAVACGYSRIEDCVHYLNDELKNQLLRDHLTGLYNQRGFLRRAAEVAAENPDRTYILALGDINGLGGINDLYGNSGGDRVLNYIAKTFEEFCDKTGVCGRMGGGVFACLFENTPENKDRFMEITRFSIAHLDMEYPLSLKFGMYETGDNTMPMDRAMLYATYAFRTSKDRSRNTYTFYTDKMSQNISSEAEVTQKMKTAMENGEFVLFLQPKFNHITEKMVGAEVLSRWIKPGGDMVSPGIFIPVFEKNGYITELDRHVWKSSFEIVSEWIKQGLQPVPVSVNISRISLVDDGILSYIAKLSDIYPSAKEYIQFEITESAYADNPNEIFDRISRIREMGFLVNMDDFGSGYSSLNLLKDAPFDIIKLDMGFLRKNTNMDRGYIIISSVIDMTKALGFDVIAEGVETKEQADALAGMGCSTIQGFLYSKPLPGAEFTSRLEKAV